MHCSLYLNLYSTFSENIILHYYINIFILWLFSYLDYCIPLILTSIQWYIYAFIYSKTPQIREPRTRKLQKSAQFCESVNFPFFLKFFGYFSDFLILFKEDSVYRPKLHDLGSQLFRFYETFANPLIFRFFLNFSAILAIF